MKTSSLLITEIFFSLQGETSLSGVPFVFIRLTGCNLRCTYCDSAYAFKGGTKMSIEEVLKKISPYKTKHVLLTGGEPLLQRGTLELIRALKKNNYTISIETHGEVSIEAAAPHARIVMDIKTPSSGMSRGGFLANLPFLKESDEVKFVIASEQDYEWAKEWVVQKRIPTREILFSPAVPALGMPGEFQGISTKWLAERILADQLPVRMQIQLHKLIWGADRKGV
jgi:7-carboxy-7-deazaguanine synthase